MSDMGANWAMQDANMVLIMLNYGNCKDDAKMTDTIVDVSRRGPSSGS